MLAAADIEGRALHPLSDLLDGGVLPDFAFDFGDSLDFLDSVYYTGAAIEADGDSVRCDITLVLPDELAIAPAGTDSFAFVIGGTTGMAVFRLEAVIGPELSLTIEGLEFALRFPPDLLARESDGKGAVVSVTADVRVDTEFGISLDNVSGASLERCKLLGTEIVVEADDVKLSLNPVDPIPEVAAQPGFQGVYFDELDVEIPGEYLNVTSGNLEIKMQGASIGTTGFTGDVTVTPPPGSIAGDFLGFHFKLRSVELDFIQNAVRKAAIGLDVRLEYFEEGGVERWAALDVSVSRNGSFSAALSAAQPTGADTSASGAGYALSLPIQGVLRLDIGSLAVEKTDDQWTIWLGGGATMLFSGSESWPSVAFSRIGFTPEPRLLIPDGAGVELTKPLDVSFNNFQLNVTKLRLSFADAKTKPDRKRLALSASIHFGMGLPAGASVKGMTIDWGGGDAVGVSFEGIGIEFGVPGTFTFEGEVAYLEDGGAHEFRGHAKLDLVALDASIEIAIVIGHQDVTAAFPQEFKYLYLYADAKLMPSGIPIGNLPLAIYGFAGLVAYNMGLDLNTQLPVDERFYELFTRAPGVGIQQQQKWIKMRGQNALGVGVSLGTSDTGFTFNLKGLLAIAFPDVQLLLQAKADLLKAKTSMAGQQQGTFDALLAYSAREKTFTFDLKVFYSIESIVELDGRARVFFDFDDPSSWYAEIGRKTDMFAAHIIKFSDSWLFDGGFWFRADKVGIGTGAEIKIDLRKEAAGFWVHAVGNAGGEMQLYWDPKQWEGRLWLTGELGAGFAGLSITITLDGQAKARAKGPLYFYAHVEACIRAHFLKWSYDVCRGFNFEWTEPTPPELTAAWGEWSAKGRRILALPTNSSAGQLPDPVPTSYPLVEATTTQGVPMDAELVLGFLHPMVAATFDDYIALNDGGFETVGGQSGWAAAYRLDSVALVRDPDGAQKALDLFGTWQRGLDKPNLRLKLLSDDHFSHDGSISKTFLEEQAIDYCDPAVSTVKCVPIDSSTVEPGGATWVDEGVLVVGSDGVKPGASGTEVPSGESVTVRFPPGGDAHVETTGGDGTVGVPDGSTPPSREPAGRCVRLCELLLASRARALAVAAAYVLLWAGTGALLSRAAGTAGTVGMGLFVLLAVVVTLLLALVLCCCCRGTKEAVPDGGTTRPPGGGMTSSLPPGGGRTKVEGPTDQVTVTGGPSGTTVTEICWEPGHGPQNWREQSQRGGWISTQPAWDVAPDRKLLYPDTTYELTVAHTTLLRAPAGGAPDAKSYTRKARFKTSGPPRIELGLTPYVQEQYPSAGQRPVYRNYDIAVAFNEVYVDLMYWIAGDRLVFRLFDKDGEPIVDANGDPVELTNPWAAEPTRWVDTEEQTWTQLMQENVTRGCIDGFDGPKTPNTQKTRVYVSDPSGFRLTANSAYEAWLVAESQPALPLYRWSFTTSSYGTFTDLFESGGTKPRVWSQAVSAQAAQTGAAAGFDALATAFGLPLVAYAEQVDFTAVVVAGGSIHSVLVDSPEPLDLGARTQLSVGGQPVQAVPNGDGTRAFLFRSGGQGWQAADTTLRATFARDAGAGLPVLTVAGDDTGEVSDLVLTLGDLS